MIFTGFGEGDFLIIKEVARGSDFNFLTVDFLGVNGSGDGGFGGLIYLGLSYIFSGV